MGYAVTLRFIQSDLAHFNKYSVSHYDSLRAPRTEVRLFFSVDSVSHARLCYCSGRASLHPPYDRAATEQDRLQTVRRRAFKGS